jgi:uncharacterized membrane protein
MATDQPMKETITQEGDHSVPISRRWALGAAAAALGAGAVLAAAFLAQSRANIRKGFSGGKSHDRRQLMQRTSSPSRAGNTIAARVTIRCPVEEVFRFYQDFKNLPSFMGDVMDIEPIGPTTSRWTIQGPLGMRVNWTIKVTEERTNKLIRYETVTSPGRRTYWEIHFAPGPETGETEVREVMKAPLGRVGRAGLALIGKYPAKEVSANLHRLKQVLEMGRVTDTSYAVRGKFKARKSQ